jgi:4-hydroxybenzoate polyprenyltransferase
MLLAWFRLLRPLHWFKNLFVLAPLLFARALFDPVDVILAVAAFGCFCLLSSAVYVVNDVVDADQDRLHPEKAHRPIAAGAVQPDVALVMAALLGCGAVAGCFLISFGFGLVGIGYLGLNLIYSLWLKRMGFVDVGLIASGFVLRVVGGALAIDVVVSVWLVICTFFLAALLGFGKRHHELCSLGDSSTQTRLALAHYTIPALKTAEWITAAVTLLAYLAYTVAPGTVAKFNTTHLLWTLPFPAFGMWRYLKLVGSPSTQSPTDALVTDWPSLLNLLGYVITVTLILYYAL